MQTSVLVLYNQPETAGHSEAGVLNEVAAVGAALDKLNIKHRQVGVHDLKETADILGQCDEKVVFNLVEGFNHNIHDVNFVPALCRSLGKAYTGNDTPALSISLDKWQSKLVLESAGLPVPKGWVVAVGHKANLKSLGKGPFIVKPVATDASEGIDFHSIVEKAGPKLAALVSQIHKDFGQPAIIEKYIDGRELNVSVMQAGDEVRVLPLAEIDFGAFKKGTPRIVGYGAKWHEESFEFNNTPRIIPAPLDSKIADKVRWLALDAWGALGCQDYTRVDFRLDKKNNPYILEVNPNPDISPDAGFAAALAAAGIDYADFIKTMVENAAGRLGTVLIENKAKASDVKSLRPSTTSDRTTVLEFLKATSFFRADEIDIAMEVLDEANEKGPSGHYKSYVLKEKQKAIGWICWGATPCSIGTYDIYWIAVDPAFQAKGVGSKLMNFAHEKIRQSGGRLAIIETSGKPIYHPTRKFYLKLGYCQAARVLDFYGPDDDKIIYTKRV